MAFKGALVTKSADQTTLNFTTPTALTFNTETYDTDAWHDTGSNTSRLTVPSGVTKVCLLGYALLSLVTGNDLLTLEIRKNGSPLVPAVSNRTTANITTPRLQVISPVLTVTTGDYFELFLTTGSDTSITVQAASWFSIWEVPASPPTFSGAVAKKNADQTAANYTTATALTFDTDVYDTDGWHDTGSNTSRMTVPSGVSYVQLVGQVGLSSFTALEFASLVITKGGSGLTPAVQNIIMSGALSRFQVISPPLPVSAAQYFEMTLQVQTDTSITVVADETWLSIWKVD